MFNYLKDWRTKIGDLTVWQSATPVGDKDELLVITGFRPPGIVESYSACSRIAFADVEQLASDQFRLKLAREHIEKRLAEMRNAVTVAEQSLGLPHLVEGEAAAS